MNDERPTHLDLFSGIGGFALAAQWAGFRTIGFCEIDKYCQKVLTKNFLAQPYSAGSRSSHRNTLHEGRTTSESRRESVSQNSERQNGSAIADHWPASSIFSDIFDLDGRKFAGVDLITGGFPCQPFSVAGKRRGAADDRAIWPEMFRVIKEARPTWVLGENVPGIISMELDNVLSDLEGIGYSTRSFIIPACAVDARHRRDRVWIITRDISNSAGGRREQCHSEPESSAGIICPSVSDSKRNGRTSNSERRSITQEPREESSGSDHAFNPTRASCTSTTEQNVSDAEHSEAARQRQHGGHGLSESKPVRSGPCCWDDEREWSIKSGMGRVAHGIPYRMDRIKGLGNAIVPQVAYEILREIRKLI